MEKLPISRVAVTGLGAVSPLGLDVPTVWQKLVSGESGVARITRFDPAGFETQIAAEVKGFDASERLDAREARRMDRFAQFAVVAAGEAVADAGLNLRTRDPFEVGAIVSSGFGGAQTLAEGFDVFYHRGPTRLRPLQLPMMISNMAAAQVAMQLGIRGPNYSIASACASSTHAIGEAAEIVRRGDARVMLAGGTEAGITPITVAALNAMRVLSTRNDEPERASRPFDAQRDGFVPGEGAAILVLEDLEYALQRGARILAELVGYGATADAAHITAPDSEGAAAIHAIRRALEKARLGTCEVDYINAHGTATRLNDPIETKIIKEVFGPAAPNIPISSTKSMTGHLMSAAGALEAVVCVLALRDGIVPPTINYEHRDPECDLYYVPNRARSIPLTTAMSNSMGFGGQNAVLIFRTWED